MAKRRLQKYVDSEVQSSLLNRLCVHWILFMIANVVTIGMWTKLIDTPAEPWEATLAMTCQRVFPFLLISFSLAPVFIWDAIKLSNRFAGPIVRVRSALAQIAEGQTPKAIEFRHGDFWKALASDFNRAFAKAFASDASKASDKL